jgi:hypothetical protein
MPYQKVTLIEDLPELEQVEKTENNIQDDRVRRFLRPGSNIKNLPQQSGMYIDQQLPPQMQMPPQMPPVYHRDEKIVETYTPPKICCQDVYEHINDCQICKKFYKTDNTVYLIIIAILTLVCALLLKKVLKV